MKVVVNCSSRLIRIDGRDYPCRIGRAGAVAIENGREGDEKTPCGDYFFRFGFYRADRLKSPPPSQLTMRAIAQDDGWCDDPVHPAYNRFITLPFDGSHEKLWREDGAYDVVLVISHNDAPPLAGLGSAVFVHIAQPDDRQTLGCVAVTPDVMVKLLRAVGPQTPLSIQK